MEKATEKAMPRIPPLVYKAEDVMQDADTLLNALKGVWPISSHVPVNDEKAFVPADSHD